MISEPEMTDALARSGYLIESRVSDWFNSNEFFVEPNFTYYDDDSQKSREVDLYVDKNNSFIDTKLKYVVNTNFIIETINNAAPIVFFLNRNSIAEDNVFSQVNYFSNIPGTENDYLFSIDYRKLHYFTDLLATQYCSFVEKKKTRDNKTEWMAYHPDDLYETFKKLLICSEKILNKEQNELLNEDWHSLFRYQPVLLLKDNLFEAKVEDKDFNLFKKQRLSFAFSHTYSTRHKSMIIDIITESFLPDYIKMILEEDKIIFDGMKNKNITILK